MFAIETTHKDGFREQNGKKYIDNIATARLPRPNRILLYRHCEMIFSCKA